MNYHHFHLGTAIETKGHVARTDDMIFASVTRDEFTAVGIFDHTVFDHGSPERMRLWRLHDRITFRGRPPGTVLLSNPIATSGHTLHAVHYAQQCAKHVMQVEPHLDDPGFVAPWFEQADLRSPPKPKFEWYFGHLDLAVVECRTRCPFWLTKGWN